MTAKLKKLAHDVKVLKDRMNELAGAGGGLITSVKGGQVSEAEGLDSLQV